MTKSSQLPISCPLHCLDPIWVGPLSSPLAPELWFTPRLEQTPTRRTHPLSLSRESSRPQQDTCAFHPCGSCWSACPLTAQVQVRLPLPTKGEPFLWVLRLLDISEAGVLFGIKSLLFQVWIFFLFDNESLLRWYGSDGFSCQKLCWQTALGSLSRNV